MRKLSFDPIEVMIYFYNRNFFDNTWFYHFISFSACNSSRPWMGRQDLSLYIILILRAKTNVPPSVPLLSPIQMPAGTQPTQIPGPFFKDLSFLRIVHLQNISQALRVSDSLSNG